MFNLYTVCPKSLDPFDKVSYFIKLVKTSWTFSTLFFLDAVPGDLLEDEAEVGEDDALVHILSQLNPLNKSILNKSKFKCG